VTTILCRFCCLSVVLVDNFAKMAGRGGRNDDAIAAALHDVAQAVGQPQVVGAGVNDGVRMLETFLRNHPPTFKGRYDPDGAQTWLKEIERVF